MNVNRCHPNLARVLALGLAGILTAPAIAEESAKKRPPNVVLIVTDDAGWADFGFNGCPDYATPNMDRIAKEGVKFSDGYVSAPVCSPSRAGLLTGRYQTSFGHEFNIVGHRTQGLPLDQKLISDRFHDLGYATGAFGKWHLGGGKGHQPFERGFDVSYGFITGSRDYLAETGDKAKDNDRAWRRNGTPEVEHEYATDAIRRESVDFIAKHADRPFFVYAAFNCPHSPMQAKPGYEKLVGKLPDRRRTTIAAMMRSQDEAVGAILAELKERKLEGETLVWLLNDNGAGTYAPFNNGPWRGNKGSLWEGGVRVAFAARWPGVIPAGSTYKHPAISLDIAASSLAAGGAKPDERLDGVNLLPHLKTGDDARAGGALFWHYANVGAIRQGDWKLLLLDDQPAALYQLAEDPSEKTNRLSGGGEKAAELAARYREWNKKTVPALWRGDSPKMAETMRRLHQP